MLDTELKNVMVNTQSSIRIAGERTVYVDPLKLEGKPEDAAEWVNTIKRPFPG